MSSVQVCMDSSTKWQANMMQERGLKAQDDVLSCSRPLLERRPVKQQTDQAALKCPRCDSTNTKFCYYNNYSLSQPRHFCKACRRYWTRGGALRNVPVGGGCRKNKRSKRSGLDIHNGVPSSTSTSSLIPSSSDLVMTNPLIHQAPISSMHYGVPNGGNDINMIFARIQQASRMGDRFSNSGNSNMGLGHSSLMPSNLVSSLLNTSHSAALKSSFSGLEFPSPINARHDQGNEDFYSFIEPNPHIAVPPNNLGMFPPPTSTDGMHNNSESAIPWTRLNQQPRIPLHFIPDEQQLPSSEGQPSFNAFNCDEHHADYKPKVKVEEPDQSRLVSEWQMVPTTSENLFHTGGDPSDYWHGGSWPDLIGSSTGPLV